MTFKQVLILCLLFITTTAMAGSANEAIQKYVAAGATDVSAERGQQLWQQEVNHPQMPTVRSCASCHGSDLTQPGKHVKTKKVIKPMALSVNPKRYTDDAKLEKWFLRNCKWTWGRECTAQEKADILQYLSQQ